MKKFTLHTVKELQAMKATELEKYAVSLQESRLELSHEIATNKNKSTHQLGQLKRQVARVKTISSMKEKE